MEGGALKDLLVDICEQMIIGCIILVARMFRALDIHLVVFVGRETVGIEIPEGLDCGREVGIGIWSVGGRELKCQWFGPK